MAAPLGVGIIGAGPGASALHLPTLARLPELFRVVSLSDHGSGRAQELAARHGAAAATSHEELLQDPDVQVVAVCSPPDRHAGHVIAAVEAGKRAILCEKPLATSHSEVERAVDACRERGVALVTGTNHLYDAAWGRAKHHLLERGGQVRTMSATLVLPPNERYHELVSERLSAAKPLPRQLPDLEIPQVAAAVVRQLLLGLAIHDLPLVRDLAPDFERVIFARALAPIGCMVGFVASGVPVRLTARMLASGPEAQWRVRIATDDDEIDVDFPPSFVHGGGATVTVRDAEGRTIHYPPAPEDGYIAEWRALAALVGGSSPVEYDEIAADAHFALSVADAAAAVLGQEVSR